MMNNYRTRIWPERRGTVAGHAFTVHDPRGREIACGWEPGDRRWTLLVARDAIAEHQAARSAVAA